MVILFPSVQISNFLRRRYFIPEYIAIVANLAEYFWCRDIYAAVILRVDVMFSALGFCGIVSGGGVLNYLFFPLASGVNDNRVSIESQSICVWEKMGGSI